jgi:hypothetical protein
MFGKSEEAKWLDEEIGHQLRALKNHRDDPEEYQKILDRVSTLQKLKEEEKSGAVSKDNLALVFGNLAGIFMIIKHEHVNIITSKAVQLILKPFTRV